MSDPHFPGENNEVAKRFRRLSDSDESKESGSQDFEEFIAEETDHNQLQDDTSATEREEIRNNNLPDAESSIAGDEVDREQASPNQPTESSIPDKLPGGSLEQRDTSSQEPVIEFPKIDEYGMPIPRRSIRQNNHSMTIELKPSVKTQAPISYSETTLHTVNKDHKNRSLSPRPKKLTNSKHSSSAFSMKQGMGCLLRMFLLAVLAGIIIILFGGSIALYEYYNIAATLPSVSDLQQKASAFETTRIFDRNGNLLYEILDPTAGRRTFITLDKISPYMVAATIATEDKSFYSHPGFDWTAIARAFWQNFRGGETISGASTITQQLARGLLFSPEERTEQSYIRKVREALLAAEITRRYTKDQILELYLNEFYYGNLAYGVEAASETYFGVSADKLDLAQASFLAGLPQAPSIYDVYQDRDAVRDRQKQVLTLMYEASNEQGCIYVSNHPERICVDSAAAIDAYTALENYEFHPPDVQIKYPHWVNYVRSILETQFDAQTIYRSGFSVYTTIDPVLQNEAEQVVKQQIDTLQSYNANNAALVAIKPSSGEILAMVGSADFYNDAIDGQVNMAISPTRQPGSSIKPITYVAAFEKGWTPASLIWDVPTEFPPSGDPNDPRPPYVPVNYDGRFHGPVTARSALANSYNIPAVKALQFSGIYDDPNTPDDDGTLAVAKRMGITSLTRSDYGLSLTLGGGEVSLLDMTSVYSTLANYGKRVPPIVISKILDHRGNVVYDFTPPQGDQVILPEHAFLITSILSDNDARTPMFGSDSVLNLPFTAAAKTGTSNDYRDNWTLGYTPDIAVGVWVGNADYSPMEGVTGVSGAAPIWSQIMQYAIQNLFGGNSSPFNKPNGIIERIICSASGTEPSQWCSNQRSEYFSSDQPPLPSSEDFWAKIIFDGWTGLEASPACPDFTKEKFAVNITDPWAIGWIQNSPEGKSWVEEMGFDEPILFAPQRECQASDPHPMIELSNPSDGQTITQSPLDLIGKIDATADFQNFVLEYGSGSDPSEWKEFYSSDQPVGQGGKIYTWDLNSIPPGIITLKIRMNSIRGGFAERLYHFTIQVPTPTPTSTPSPTPTLIPTQTIVPSPTQTVIPTISPSESPTPEATDSSTPTNTPSPDTNNP